MRIEYETKLKDVVLFGILNFFLSFRAQAFVMILMLYVFWSRLSYNSVLYSVIYTICYYIGFWLFLFIFFPLYLCSRDNRSMFTKHTMEITDDYLLEETKYNKSYHYWFGILKVVSLPWYIAIYIAGVSAHVIPNRAFKSREEREEFLKKVLSRYPDR